MDLALNNLQRLICHKTKQTKPNQGYMYEAKKTYWKIVQLKEENIIKKTHLANYGQEYRLYKRI